MGKSVICIGRECGSAIKDIRDKLADRLNIPLGIEGCVEMIEKSMNFKMGEALS